jgi:hypothetical protein
MTTIQRLVGNRATSALALSLGDPRPLSQTVRVWAERGFGRDLGHVRIYTGREASHAAGVLAARAFTHGSNVVFGEGRYHPGTADGDRLIGHELAHVVQQTSGGSRVHSQSSAAVQVSQGGSASISGSVTVGVQCDRLDVQEARRRLLELDDILNTRTLPDAEALRLQSEQQALRDRLAAEPAAQRNAHPGPASSPSDRRPSTESPPSPRASLELVIDQAPPALLDRLVVAVQTARPQSGSSDASDLWIVDLPDGRTITGLPLEALAVGLRRLDARLHPQLAPQTNRNWERTVETYRARTASDHLLAYLHEMEILPRGSHENGDTVFVHDRDGQLLSMTPAGALQAQLRLRQTLLEQLESVENVIAGSSEALRDHLDAPGQATGRGMPEPQPLLRPLHIARRGITGAATETVYDRPLPELNPPSTIDAIGGDVFRVSRLMWVPEVEGRIRRLARLAVQLRADMRRGLGFSAQYATLLGVSAAAADLEREILAEIDATKVAAGGEEVLHVIRDGSALFVALVALPATGSVAAGMLLPAAISFTTDTAGQLAEHEAGLRREIDWAETSFDAALSVITGHLSGQFAHVLLARLLTNPAIRSIEGRVLATIVADIAAGRLNVGLDTTAHTLFDRARDGHERLMFDQFIDRLATRLVDRESILHDTLLAEAGRRIAAAHEAPQTVPREPSRVASDRVPAASESPLVHSDPGPTSGPASASATSDPVDSHRGLLPWTSVPAANDVPQPLDPAPQIAVNAPPLTEPRPATPRRLQLASAADGQPRASASAPTGGRSAAESPSVAEPAAPSHATPPELVAALGEHPTQPVPPSNNGGAPRAAAVPSSSSPSRARPARSPAAPRVPSPSRSPAAPRAPTPSRAPPERTPSTPDATPPTARAQARAARLATEAAEAGARARVRAHGEALIAGYRGSIAENEAANARLNQEVASLNASLGAAVRADRVRTVGARASEMDAPNRTDFEALAQEDASVAAMVRRRYGDENHDSLTSLIERNIAETRVLGRQIAETPLPVEAAVIHAELRRAANRGAQGDAVRSADVDALGSRPSPGDPMTLEHIHPLVEIVYTPGFARIRAWGGRTRVQRMRDIANDARNVTALVRSTNSTRRDEHWDLAPHWQGLSGNPERRAEMLRGAAELARRQSAFEDVLPGLIEAALRQQGD